MYNNRCIITRVECSWKNIQVLKGGRNNEMTRKAGSGRILCTTYLFRLLMHTARKGTLALVFGVTPSGISQLSWAFEVYLRLLLAWVSGFSFSRGRRRKQLAKKSPFSAIPSHPYPLAKKSLILRLGCFWLSVQFKGLTQTSVQVPRIQFN